MIARLLALLIQNTMDEVIAATAYLDSFLRTINEPTLLKMFLRFILCAKIDSISLLETLIQRVQSTSKVRETTLEANVSVLVSARLSFIGIV